jgi:hypothetical protein
MPSHCPMALVAFFPKRECLSNASGLPRIRMIGAGVGLGRSHTQMASTRSGGARGSQAAMACRGPRGFAVSGLRQGRNVASCGFFEMIMGGHLPGLSIQRWVLPRRELSHFRPAGVVFPRTLAGGRYIDQGHLPLEKMTTLSARTCLRPGQPPHRALRFGQSAAAPL